MDFLFLHDRIRTFTELSNLLIQQWIKSAVREELDSVMAKQKIHDDSADVTVNLHASPILHSERYD